MVWVVKFKNRVLVFIYFLFNSLLMGLWYTSLQALCFAITFSVIDILINLLGLAWDGKFFTIDNIRHWFDFRYYYFTINPIDFLVCFFIN